jgi:uncharacterized protein YutE (UPF0331/DUF86 family)
MAIEQAVRAQLNKLISDGQTLAPGESEAGQVRDENHRSECVAWLVAAEHLVTLVCKNPTDIYRKQVSGLAASHAKAGYVVNNLVGQATGILRRLSEDIDNGLITSITIAASAEVLDDLLDQAKEYHKRGNKEGAAILATVIFEDSVRRLARASEISDAGTKADQIISELDKRDVITGVMAKRCRVAAGVRNHALHAQWDELSLEDVGDVIRLTHQLLTEHLSR